MFAKIAEHVINCGEFLSKILQTPMALATGRPEESTFGKTLIETFCNECILF
jgi:hypothetical protein